MRHAGYAAAAVVLFSGSAIAQESPCWANFAGQDGFESVVKAKPGVKQQAADANTVSYATTDKSIVWNFATKANPAFPSVACRRLVKVGTDIRLATEIRCGASGPECEKLAAAYRALDEQAPKAAATK